eukprot:XP_011677451.1 PREDICTED: uncharacterized protein LOC105444646 [Strongylocentrotus purpuratus]
MNLEMTDDSPGNTGGIGGLTGHLWSTYVANPDDPGTYLQVKEEMIGTVNVPSVTSDTSSTVSSMFSSDFVDYQDEVDEAWFQVPENCRQLAGGKRKRRSPRAPISSEHFRLAHYAAAMFAHEP